VDGGRSKSQARKEADCVSACGKVAPAPGGCNQKGATDDNPKTRIAISLRFHDPQPEHRGAIPEARTKAEAEQAEVKIKNKVYERKYGKIAARRNFAEFVNGAYLPWARANKRSSRDELHANVFCRHFGKKALNEIDQQMIEEFKVKRMKTITRYGRPRKPASVNRELAILSGIFTMAVNYEEIAQNPCRRVESLPENNQRTRHLSFDEEDRLFAALTGDREDLRALVTVAIYSGPRRGELLKLRWSNVDFDLNAINFTETKTNRDRSVPMEPIVQEPLLDLRDQAGDAEYVFTNPDTGTRYADIKKSFSAACREAGITNFTFHDLRHTFGTRLADAGVDVVKIKELMGHASIVTTMRYIHATDKGKRGAITVLSEYRKQRRHKFVTKEKRQTLQPAASH
jgi:integrase